MVRDENLPARSGTARSPRVSIIIPVYNRGHYLEGCIASVLAQTCADYEILLFDDGSTDGAYEIALELWRRHPDVIRLMRHDDGGNHGIAATRNLAIRRARGEFIGFLDTDDFWNPDKIEKQLRAFDAYPEAAICYGQATFMDAEGNDILHDRWSASGHGGIERPADIFHSLLKENKLYGVTVMIRRDRFMEAGMYPEEPRHTFEDWVVYCRIAYFHPVVFIAEPLARFRFHSGSYSTVREIRLNIDAEKHYILQLYDFLGEQGQAEEARYRAGLSISLRRFLFRARAHGVPLKDIRAYAVDMAKHFPSQHGTIFRIMRIVAMTPSSLGSMIRRVRRRIIRL